MQPNLHHSLPNIIMSTKDYALHYLTGLIYHYETGMGLYFCTTSYLFSDGGSVGQDHWDFSMCTLLDGWYTFSMVSFTKVSIPSGILVSRQCGIQANF